MDFLIKEPIPAADFVPNSFSVYVTVMHGDADLYTDFVMPGFVASNQLSVELMKDLLRTLDKMESAFVHTGRGGEEYERYAYSVPQFEPWFSPEDLAVDYTNAWYRPNSLAGEEHLMSLAQEVSKHYGAHGRIAWPADATMRGINCLHKESTLESYEVRYIDAQGTQHAVEVQPD